MSIELNDPKLTAYALGELDDADRGEVERFLESSADAQDIVGQIRATADALEHELAADSDPRLTDEQRQRIEATILASKLRRWLPRAAAASIVLAVVGVTASMQFGGLSRARELSGETMLAMSREVESENTEFVPAGSESVVWNLEFTPPESGKQTSSGKVELSANLRGIGQAMNIDASDPAATGSSDAQAELWATINDNNTTPKQFNAPSEEVDQGGHGQSVIKLWSLSPDSARKLIDKLQNGAKDGENAASKLTSEDQQRLAALGYVTYATDRESIGKASNGKGGMGGGGFLGGSDDDPVSNAGHGVLWLDLRANKDNNGAIPWHKDIKYPPDWLEITARREGVEEPTDDEQAKIEPGWWTRRRQPDPQYRQTGEDYARILDNPFKPVLQEPLSTFSVDVDTGSYSNVRRMLTAGQLPPPDAVRIEEMVNYFAYDYAPPTGEHPFAVHLEEAACPWAEGRRLVRIGLKGREIDRQRRPACNLVFLIDVSGSMSPANKLPLLKQAMSLLTNQLTGEDRVGIVVYAGESGVALDSTPAGDRAAILNAIEQMESGGSTNGGAGIDAAYGIATSHFIEGGVNRVILATDGDFNVGVTERGELIRLIKEKAKSGVFLSVLGFGMGNLKDATLEQLADTGNGHYAYIDTFREAKKVLVDDIAATLVPIAKDVKIQIEFNPSQVASYRLIGYENRVMAARDFNDDAKDAGEIGAGHTVTALYEIVPAAMGLAGVDPLKYQAAVAAAKNDSATVTNDTAPSDELLTVKLRYKLPHGDVSTLIEAPLSASERGFESASGDLRLAASVAGFGMLLRCSPHKGDLTIDSVIQMAVGALGADSDGRRAELVDLMRRAKSLRGN